MHKKMGTLVLLVMWAGIVAGDAFCRAEAADTSARGTGLLEMDCNIAGIDLYLCPKDNYVKKETKAFFGLITSVKYVCSSEEISVGKTPLRPTAVSAGTYILMIPPDYVWEEEGTIELTILPEEKTYFLLKLFRSRASSPGSDHGGGGGAAGAGRGH